MTKWPLNDHAASTWHHGDDNNMAGIEICEPSTLYNIITQVSLYEMFNVPKSIELTQCASSCCKTHGPAKPALLNDTHLLLLGKPECRRMACNQ